MAMNAWDEAIRIAYHQELDVDKQDKLRREIFSALIRFGKERHEAGKADGIADLLAQAVTELSAENVT